MYQILQILHRVHVNHLVVVANLDVKLELIAVFNKIA